MTELKEGILSILTQFENDPEAAALIEAVKKLDNKSLENMRDELVEKIQENDDDGPWLT